MSAPGARPSQARLDTGLIAALRDRPLGPVYELTDEVLGSTVQILVVRGSPSLLEDGRARAAELLGLWRGPGNELDDATSAAGRTAQVSPETLLLADLARRSAEDEQPPGGKTDPLGGCQLVGSEDATVTLTAEGVRQLRVIDRAVVADLLARDLVDAGALGCCVRVGDDARMLGIPPRIEGWRVEVVRPGEVTHLVMLEEGGVSTRGMAADRTTVTAQTAWQAAGAADAANRTVVSARGPAA